MTKKLAFQVLKDLMDAKQGIYVFKMPGIYKIEVADVFPFIEEYKHWLNYSNGKLKINDYSRNAVKLALTRNNKIADQLGRDNIPLKFEGAKIKIDDFYLPRSIRHKN